MKNQIHKKRSVVNEHRRDPRPFSERQGTQQSHCKGGWTKKDFFKIAPLIIPVGVVVYKLLLKDRSKKKEQERQNAYTMAEKAQKWKNR
ncbi:MAG: hypothetical protein K2L34_01735, partial [Muribaculaceae bacterium]|nr:hypothetical protein [Muribaculaceae bacterium]